MARRHLSRAAFTDSSRLPWNATETGFGRASGRALFREAGLAWIADEDTSWRFDQRTLTTTKAGRGAMSRTIRNNLLIAMAQLLITMGLFGYPIFLGRQPPWLLLAPISLLTFGPLWGLYDALDTGSYGGFLAILCLDIVFLSIMAFSIMRNHKFFGGISLFVFNFLSIGFIAAGY
jgi:hypothetical protein